MRFKQLMMEQLINAFEEEKRNLERFIKEALVDNPEAPDYLTAFQYEKGLTTVNHFLEVLRTFDDAYYWEKQRCRDFIQRHADADKNSFYINEYLKEKKEQCRLWSPGLHYAWIKAIFCGKRS